MPGCPRSAPELTICLLAVGQSQDRTAFIILFEHYAPQLKTYFRGREVPSSMADDLVQETMLTLWRKAHHYDPAKGSPSAWVFTIARNLRATKLRERRFTPIEGDLLWMEDPAERADGLLAASETESRLHQALKSLPKEDADLLRASFLEQKSHPDIARERNLPIGTVKSRLRRTLARLRKAWFELP